MKALSPVQLFATPWTAAYQAPLSMRFSRQEYWSGLPFPSPKTSRSIFKALKIQFESVYNYSAIKRNEIESFVEMRMDLSLSHRVNYVRKRKTNIVY